MNFGIFLRSIIFSLILIVGLNTELASATVQTFEGNGQYIMSEFENPNIARMRAQQQAEYDAQRKAGVYIRNFSRIVNSKLTDNEIYAVTNDIINVSDVKIVEENVNIKGKSAKMYKVTLKATIDTDGIYKFNNLNEQEKLMLIQKNTDFENAIKQNLEQAEKLKQRYGTYSQKQKKTIQSEFKQSENLFLATQQCMDALKLATEGKNPEAMKLLDESLKLAPNLFLVHYSYGVFFSEHLNDYSHAVDSYSKAMELQPYFAGTYSARSLANFALGNFNQAIEDCTTAIQLDTTSSDMTSYLYGIRAIMHYSLKNYELSIKDFNKAIQLKEDNNHALYSLRSKSYVELGQYENAIKDLDISIQMETIPEYLVEDYLLRGSAYAELKDYDKALSDFKKVLEIDMKNFKSYALCAFIYYKQEKYSQAIEICNKLIQLRPNYGAGYFLRFKCYQGLGIAMQHLEDMQKAIELGYEI